MAKTHRLRRFLAVTAAILAALLVLAWLTRSQVLGPLAVRLLRGPLEHATGARLSVERVGGSWLGGLVLEGVSLVPLAPEERAERAPDPALLVELDGATVSASWGPGLFLGRLEALEELSIEARRLALEPVEGAPDAGPEEGEEDAPLRLPERLPRLSLALGELSLTLGEGQRLSARGLALEAEGEELTLEAELGWKDPAREVVLPLAAGGRWRAGRIEELALTLGADGLVRLEDAGFDLGSGAWHARGALARGTLRAQGDGEGLSFALAGVGLGELASLVALPVEGTLDAEGELAFGSPEGAPELALALRLEAPAWEDLRLDRLEGRLELSGATLRVPALSAARGANRLAATDWVVPLGPLVPGGPGALVAASRGSLTAELADVPDLVGAEPAPEHRVQLAGDLAEGTLRLTTGRVETAGGSLVLRRGQLAFEEGLDWSAARVEAALDLSVHDLSELARLVGRAERWSGSVEGLVELEGRLGAPSGRLEARVAALEAAGRLLGDGALRLDLDPERVELHALELRGPAGSLSAAGTWALVDERLHDVRVEARLDDPAALGLEGIELGAARLALFLDGPLAEPVGTLSASADALAAGGLRADAARLEARFQGRRATLDELAITRPDGSLVLGGTLERPAGAPLSAVVERLDASYRAAHLTLEAPAALTFRDAAHWRLEPLALRGAGSARIEAERDGERLRASLDTEGFDPTPLFVASPLEDVRTSGVDARVRVEQEGEELRASFDLSVPSLRTSLEDAPWTAILRGGFDGRRVHLERLALAHEHVGTLSAAGGAPFEPGAAEPLAAGELELELALDLRLDALSRRVPALAGLGGRARASARVEGGWHETRARLVLDGEELVLGFLGEAFAGERADLSLALEAGERWVLGPARFEGAALGSVRAEGTLDAPLRAADLVRGRLEELLGAPLDVELALGIEDVGPLATLTPAMRRAQGALEGSLSVSGTPRDPALAGELRLRGGEVRLAADFPALEALDAELRFERSGGEDPGTLRLERLSGELGAAPFRATGEVSLGSPPRVALELVGDNLLLARQSGVRVRADAELRVSGDLAGSPDDPGHEPLTVTGTLRLTEGRYGRDIDFLGALRGEAAPPSAGGRGLRLFLYREPPLADMRLDLRIVAENPLVVKNNVASVEVRPDLRLRGTGEVPLVLGRVYVDPGRLSLPSGTLAIESGLVEFLESAPFTPRLELAGETRLKGYEIGVRVSGDALAPEIELWSTPPMASDDLLVLFLTGELPEGSVGSRSGRAAETVAVYLAKDYLSRWFSGDADDSGPGILERLDVEVGADVTRTGAPTTEVTYYFSDRPRDTGRVPYLNAERDKYDKINLGIGFLFRLR